MKDTDPQTQANFLRMMMAKSPVERLTMGCSMFSTAKRLVEASILEAEPNIRPNEMRKKVFLRFYGSDFDKKQIKRFLQGLGLEP